MKSEKHRNAKFELLHKGKNAQSEKKESAKLYSLVHLCAHVLVSYLFLLRIILTATCCPVL